MKTKYFSIRKSVSAILVTAVILCCFTLSASATIFYISPTGNDITGNGSKGNPWKTLYKATSTVSVIGDIIHVNAGTYTETQQCLLTPGVSIEGDGITSILKSTLTADWTEMLKLYSAVEGTNGSQHISNLKFDGQNLSTFWGITVSGRSNVSIHDITMVDFKDRGILINGRTDNLQSPPTVYATGNSVYNCIIDNCAAYNLSTGVYGRGCLNIGGQDGLLVYNNTISQTSRPEGYNGWPIKYWGGGYLKGCKIYNNTLNKIPLGNPVGATGWDFAIELTHESGLEIYGNSIKGGGIDLNFQTKETYPYSAWIHDNHIYDDTRNDFLQYGITLEFGTEDAIIENNTIDKKNIGIGFVPRNGDIVKNIMIRKNLITNVSIAENTGYLILMSGNSNQYYDSVDIFNNTMLIDPAHPVFYGIGFPPLSSGYIKHVNIKNNISANAVDSWISHGGNVKADFVNVSYNDTYGNGNNNNPNWVVGTPTNYTNINNINIMPTFSANFTLTAGSPLIDAGVYVGIPYIGSAPDRGYAEFNAILPINLLEFIATDNKGKNLLQWKTATEVNSDHFTIERSTNGNDFTSIGTVQASGFSSNIMSYTFTDINPLPGINYYRLVMIDKDNASAYSNVVSVNLKNTQSMNIVNVQLSSSKNNLSFSVTATQNIKALLMVFDANGRNYLNMPVVLQSGLNRVDKNLGNVAKGIYYIRLVTTDASIVKNVMATE